jgi:hypothetical protein
MDMRYKRGLLVLLVGWWVMAAPAYARVVADTPPQGTYRQLATVFGNKLYNRLLESDHFLKVQGLLVGYWEQQTAHSQHPTRKKNGFTPAIPKSVP